MTHLFADEVLGGKWFRLRPLDDRDVQEVTTACQDSLIQGWLSLPQPYTCEVARSFIGELAPRQLAEGRGIVRAIEVDGRLSGVVDLKNTDWRAGLTEVGYWVAPWGRGRGLAGQAGQAIQVLANWALTAQGMERVVIQTASGNIASQKAAMAAGFVREGVARSAGYVYSGRVDLVLFGKIKADL